jgi:hypothetical protein
VGDLAAVEEIYALKLLMQSLGVANIDARQDGTVLSPPTAGPHTCSTRPSRASRTPTLS